MLGKIFGKEQPVPAPAGPEIMGLRIGSGFEIDTLTVKLRMDELVIGDCASTHIIHSAGLVDIGETQVYRFYTDDDAWLQVVVEGGNGPEHVRDVKLFHYFDTKAISAQVDWDNLLHVRIGANTFSLAGKAYDRVWTSTGDYHPPVHFKEITHDQSGDPATTDQFCMLFERTLSDGSTESLFVSAEEIVEPTGQLSRCLVLSTGITLTPSQITIHG